jgi:ketosteroid isomerase-like protein
MKRTFWMKGIAAALVIGALTAASRFDHPPPPAQPGAAAARAVVAGFAAALQAGDSLRALRLLHPGLVVYESGVAEDLAHYRSHHLAADIAFLAQVRSRTVRDELTVSGAMALYTREYRSQGTWRGRAIDSAGTETLVLMRTREGWRIRHIHWSSRD